MGQVIPQIVAPDNYTPASTIEAPNITGITIDVVNATILWQLKLGTTGGGGVWEAIETPMIPGSRRIGADPGDIVGIRIRAKTPAAQIPAGSNQAIVTVRTVP